MTPPRAAEDGGNVVRLSTFSWGWLWLVFCAVLVAALMLATDQGWVKQPQPNDGRPPATSQEGQP